MQKNNVYYRFMVLANLLAIPNGCGYYSENYRMMDSASASSKNGSDCYANSAVNQYANSNTDEVDIAVQSAINNLLEQLTKYCFSIKKDRHLHINFIKITSEFRFIQYQSNIQKRDLMKPISIASMYGSRISQAGMKKNKIYNPYALDNPTFLTSWREEMTNRLKELLSNNHFESLEYLNEDLLPYFGEIVKWLIFESLNTSFAQTKIDLKKAQAQYEKASKIIEFIYSPDHIGASAKYFYDKIHTFNEGTNHRSNLLKILKNLQGFILGSSNNIYTYLKEVEEEIKKYTLAPIDNMYNVLNILINGIKYDDSYEFTQNVAGSLQVFYNIAYSFSLLDLIFTFVRVISVYTSNIGYDQQKQKNSLEQIERTELQLRKAKLYLANFIANNDNIDQLIQKIRSLLVGDLSITSD